jgi:hypothetical protein
VNAKAKAEAAKAAVKTTVKIMVKATVKATAAHGVRGNRPHVAGCGCSE